ncbi:MAG: class I SAM-dependent methyltransferase [Chloroflexi bacterium]|nr:class I SAM-dependent methyltransferase [Chloroflexota bacterium]
MDDLFAPIAPFYDWEHAGFQDDIPLYRAFARRCGGPVLELACGTGRVLLPLAEEVEIEGLDASAAMLAIARAKLRAAGLKPERARVHQADLLSFQLGRRFGMAFIALDSFGLLLRRRDQVAALRRAREHLAEGGLLLVDVSNGNLRGGGPSSEFSHQLSAPFPPSGHLLAKFIASETDVAEQLDTLTYFYDETLESGTVKRVVATLALRYFGRFELELLLEQGGFTVEELYGSYDLQPFGPTSERLIAVARRA